eukprot:gnl/TRDRNA2_/TRDRNA2_176693_c3_seq3.p1 gnl/TRDRNA2_/TRDRNA2_176693_c3~~gnl/TRDRNA2_/TRDRNA2_176693_c3_seq3.p1  ORF type:complete len:348 (-),score=73.73 gnl/TRDRNA2_/TRDRNA2_176693_c3_seq3:2023-3066(-)
MRATARPAMAGGTSAERQPTAAAAGVKKDGRADPAASKAAAACCVRLLEDVAAAPQAGTGAVPLRALLDTLCVDRHAVVLCRHHGAPRIVAEAWRSSPGDSSVAAAAACVLSLYTAVHMDLLRSLGVASLCAEAMAAHGAIRELAPVAKLWDRLGGPTAREAFALMERGDGDVESLRPLFKSLAARKDCQAQLQQQMQQQHQPASLDPCAADGEGSGEPAVPAEPGMRSALEALLSGGLAEEAMDLLVGAAEPLEAPPCTRGIGQGDHGAHGEESGGGESDTEPEVTSDDEDGGGGHASFDKKKSRRPRPRKQRHLTQKLRMRQLAGALHLMILVEAPRRNGDCQML